MSQDQTTQQNPTEQYAAPGSGNETVEHPGRSADLDVQPDHGEKTYKGSDRLTGKRSGSATLLRCPGARIGHPQAPSAGAPRPPGHPPPGPAGRR